MVHIAVGRNSARNGQVFPFAGTEAFAVEIRPCDWSVGPTAGGVTVVEPDTYAVGLRIECVLRIGVVDRRFELVRRGPL